MTFCCYDHKLIKVDLAEKWHLQRSFLFGDGHFTTAKIENGKVIWWNAHLARLKSANEYFHISDIDWQQLTFICANKAQEIKSGYIKVQISRGETERGYQISENMMANVFITTNSLNLPKLSSNKEPIELSTLETKLGLNPLLSGHKHCNRLEQSLIQLELRNKNLVDGIVVDINDNIVETSKANIFWRSEGRWYTPCLKNSGINGIFRAKILSHFDTIQIDYKTQQELKSSVDAMFICNALSGITAVSSFNGKSLNIDAVLSLQAEFFQNQ